MYSIITVTSITTIIPTSNSYTLRPLEEVVHFAGLLVGITRQHIYSAFACNHLLVFFFKRYMTSDQFSHCLVHREYY